jgi:lichenan operon transcriptional antiterminator
MVNNIKFTAPFIYEIAVLLGHIIYQKTHLTVNDDEIAYIALHVGTRIEEINSYKDKVRVCFVFPEYYSFRNNPLHEHFAEFTNDIVITNIYTSPLQITDNVGADLVITTVQINISRPSVIISSFVTPDDKRKIRNAIDSIRKHKASRNFQHILRSIFDPNLYQRISQYESREVAINQIGSLLKEKGYVDDEYIQKTIEREKVSATNFGKIAIPHPIDYYVPTSSIAVTILKKPLIWGTSTINVIFMLAISKSDYSYIQDVFPFLVRICSNPQQLEQIAASTSADNFMQLLLDFTK